MPRQIPAHLSDLLHRLGKAGKLFIEQHEKKKERMQAIVRELGDTSKEVQEAQKSTNRTRIVGAVLGGLGILGIGAALHTEAEQIAIFGGIAVFSGGATVIAANLTKAATESTGMQTVGELGKEFMQIIELQGDILKDILKVSEELEKKSSSLLTTTRAQTEEGLAMIKQLQQVLKRAAKLSERSKKAMDMTLNGLSEVRELIEFIATVTRITTNPEDDKKLRKCITDSARQCKRTVYAFAKMRDTLKDFEETQTE